MGGQSLDQDPVGPDALVVRVTTAGARHDAAVALLAGGRQPGATVRSWCAHGEVFALCELGGPPSEAPLAAALTIAGATGATVELRLVATTAEGRRRQAEARLLAGVADALRSDGAQLLLAVVDRTETRLATSLEAAGFQVSPSHPDCFELEL